MKPAPGQQSLFGPARTAREEHDEPRVRLNPTVTKQDATRLTQNALRVLARLRQGPATGPELLSPDVGGIGFKQRLHELKNSGFPYDKRHVRDGIWEYRLADT